MPPEGFSAKKRPGNISQAWSKNLFKIKRVSDVWLSAGHWPRTNHQPKRQGKQRPRKKHEWQTFSLSSQVQSTTHSYKTKASRNCINRTPARKQLNGLAFGETRSGPVIDRIGDVGARSNKCTEYQHSLSFTKALGAIGLHSSHSPYRLSPISEEANTKLKKLQDYFAFIGRAQGRIVLHCSGANGRPHRPASACHPGSSRRWASGHQSAGTTTY